MDYYKFMESSLATQKFGFTDELQDVITVLRKDKEGKKFIEMYFYYPNSIMKFHKIPIEFMQGEIIQSVHKTSAKLTLNLECDEDNVLYSQDVKKFL